jgi:hypothetical protein
MSKLKKTQNGGILMGSTSMTTLSVIKNGVKTLPNIANPSDSLRGYNNLSADSFTGAKSVGYYNTYPVDGATGGGKYKPKQTIPAVSKPVQKKSSSKKTKSGTDTKPSTTTKNKKLVKG